MKTIFFAIIILITSLFTTKAQESQTVFNVGAGILYGIGGHISCDHSMKHLNEHSALTAGWYAGVQRGDGYASIGNSTYEWDYKWLVSPRVGCVYSLGQRLDVFAALMPGLLIDNKYDNTHATYRFFTGITGGGRVRLFNNVSFFTEAGYNILCLNAGFSVKF